MVPLRRVSFCERVSRACSSFLYTCRKPSECTQGLCFWCSFCACLQHLERWWSCVVVQTAAASRAPVIRVLVPGDTFRIRIAISCTFRILQNVFMRNSIRKSIRQSGPCCGRECTARELRLLENRQNIRAQIGPVFPDKHRKGVAHAQGGQAHHVNNTKINFCNGERSGGHKKPGTTQCSARKANSFAMRPKSNCCGPALELQSSNGEVFCANCEQSRVVVCQLDGSFVQLRLRCMTLALVKFSVPVAWQSAARAARDYSSHEAASKFARDSIKHAPLVAACAVWSRSGKPPTLSYFVLLSFFDSRNKSDIKPAAEAMT